MVMLKTKILLTPDHPLIFVEESIIRTLTGSNAELYFFFYSCNEQCVVYHIFKIKAAVVEYVRTGINGQMIGKKNNTPVLCTKNRYLSISTYKYIHINAYELPTEDNELLRN